MFISLLRSPQLSPLNPHQLTRAAQLCAFPAQAGFSEHSPSTLLPPRPPPSMPSTLHPLPSTPSANMTVASCSKSDVRRVVVGEPTDPDPRLAAPGPFTDGGRLEAQPHLLQGFSTSRASTPREHGDQRPTPTGPPSGLAPAQCPAHSPRQLRKAFLPQSKFLASSPKRPGSNQEGMLL